MTYSDFDAREEADRLMAQGYAVVSRAGGRIARVDREDWRTYMKKHGMPVDEDWYRRCVSRDVKTVRDSVRKEMENSISARFGFRSCAIEGGGR